MQRSIFVSITGLFCLLVGACTNSSSGGDSGVFFVLRATGQAVAQTTPVEISERYVAYLAEEAETGDGMGGMFTNLNGPADTDFVDSVVTVVNVVSTEQTNVGVAALDIAWAGAQELYMVVNEEADTVDWDGDTGMGAMEFALVHWSPATGVATFVASLDPASAVRMIAVGDLLFFAEELAAPLMLGETSLSVIDTAADPLAVTPITTTSPAAAGLHPRLIRQDEGLIFCYLDENVDGAELNADGDATDGYVLALLDGTLAAGDVLNTGLAIADENAPLRARDAGASDWLVAFLVNEAAHLPDVATGFNNPSLPEFTMGWQPAQCSTLPDDVDTTDDVLHYIHFAAWATDAVMDPPRNTGLVGRDRVVVAGDYVGTISVESDDGGCDLNLDGNGDGDMNDRIARWTLAVTGTDPILPPGDPTDDLLRVADAADVPGGTFGFAELGDRFVILVSEAKDGTNYDMDAGTDFNLLAWRDPSSGAVWEFDHGTAAPFFGGATWMAEIPDRSRLMVAAPEEIDGINLNIPPSTSGPDMDLDDSVPAFNDLLVPPGEAQLRFVFSIARVAVDSDDAGMLVANGTGFYRVSEDEDTRDWNDDGDFDDFVLFRTNLTTGNSKYTGVMMRDVIGRPAIDVDLDGDPILGGAILTDEADDGPTGTDYNGDGDKIDFVLRYFRM